MEACLVKVGMARRIESTIGGRSWVIELPAAFSRRHAIGHCGVLRGSSCAGIERLWRTGQHVQAEIKQKAQTRNVEPST